MSFEDDDEFKEPNILEDKVLDYWNDLLRKKAHLETSMKIYRDVTERLLRSKSIYAKIVYEIENFDVVKIQITEKLNKEKTILDAEYRERNRTEKRIRDAANKKKYRASRDDAFRAKDAERKRLARASRDDAFRAKDAERKRLARASRDDAFRAKDAERKRLARGASVF
jgi:hypothetical protein